MSCLGKQEHFSAWEAVGCALRLRVKPLSACLCKKGWKKGSVGGGEVTPGGAGSGLKAAGCT